MNPSLVGQVKAVLVIGGTGIITSIHTRETGSKASDRVIFTGDVRVAPEIARFTNTTIIETLDVITTSLDMESVSYEVVIKNISATSVHGMGLEISGHSLDAGLLLSLLSSCLGLPVTQDAVFTGQIATPSGHLTPVSGIPEKVNAAATDKSIQLFVYPALDQDTSLELLSPDEHGRITKAFRENADQVKVRSVTDVFGLLRLAATEEDICLASLHSGFYSVPMTSNGQPDPSSQATGYLLNDNEGRFWRYLERQLLDTQFEGARSLLLAFAGHYVRRTTYPQGFGHKLLQVLYSVPPPVKRKPEFSSLLSMRNYFQLGQYAQERDYEDLKALFEASFGKTRTRKHGGAPQVPRDQRPSGNLLQHFLEELSPENLAREILLPIDTGRASYTMDSVTVENYQDFLESITAFYAHLLRHTGQLNEVDAMSRLGSDALDLAKRSFSGQGEEKAAYAEATSGTKGGLRHVFDLMTQRLKMEDRNKYVQMVLKTTIDPLNFDAKTAVIKALINQVAATLPEEILSQPPERYAADYEEIVHAYAESLEKLAEKIKLL